MTVVGDSHKKPGSETQSGTQKEEGKRGIAPKGQRRIQGHSSNLHTMHQSCSNKRLARQ